MLILVTGATGFIGSHLVNALLDAGHKVRAIAREESNCNHLIARGVEIRKGSLTDQMLVAKACEGVDIVFNLAGKMGGPGVSSDEMRTVNIAAAKLLLGECQGTSVRQFIHCSTAGVVGMIGVAPEYMPFRPVGTYERTKCEAEKIVSFYQHNGDVPTTILRPDFVYGPGDMHKLKLFMAVQNGRLPIIGNGQNLVHPTYIDDVIRGMMLVIGNRTAYGERFNLAGPRPATIRELISTIADELGVKQTRVRIPVFAAKLAALGSHVASRVLCKPPAITQYQVKFFTMNHASDTTRAEKILGYSPSVHLTEGVHNTVQWYRNHGYI